MLAEHLVEHDACRIEEEDGAQREERHIEVVAHPRAERLVEVITDEGGTHEQLHPHDIERDDILGEEQEHDGDPQHKSQDIERLGLVGTIDAHQGGREQLDEEKHDKLALRGGRVPQHLLLVAYAHDKIHHHSHPGEEDAPRHALPVEHEEESQVDQCRARLLLHDDEPHGQEHDGTREREIAHTMDIEPISAHELADGKGSGELGKLGRLYSERSHDEPRPGALDLMGIEDGDEQEQEQRGIEHIGEGVVIAVVEHEEHESQADGRAYPHHLHARPGRQAEDVGVVERIARPADTHPSEDEECHIDGDGPPIERPEHTGLSICPLFHT